MSYTGTRIAALCFAIEIVKTEPILHLMPDNGFVFLCKKGLFHRKTLCDSERIFQLIEYIFKKYTILSDRGTTMNMNFN